MTEDTTLLLLTAGEYSDFHVIGLYRVPTSDYTALSEEAERHAKAIREGWTAHMYSNPHSRTPSPWTNARKDAEKFYERIKNEYEEVPYQELWCFLW